MTLEDSVPINNEDKVSTPLTLSLINVLSVTHQLRPRLRSFNRKYSGSGILGECKNDVIPFYFFSYSSHVT